MSFIMMAKAMKVETGSPIRKLILLKLADNANDDGECYPSYQHIATQCEVNKRTVINHINALVDIGLVKKEKRKTKHGDSKSNLYTLILGGSENNSLGGGENNSLGGENNSLGGGEKYSPRTYNSSNLSKNLSCTDKEFNIFWEEYPRKREKKKAKEIWSRLKDRPSLDVIIASIKKQKKTKAWQDITFVPYPTSWLNGAKWDDIVTDSEIVESTENGNVYFNTA